MGRALPNRPVIALAAIVLTLGACAQRDEDKPPAPKTPEAGVVTLATEAVPLFIELPGRTAAYETSEVRPQVSGLITARNFTEGSLVIKGQTLYRIDPRLYEAATAQARANLASAEAARVSAQALADRYKPLAQIEAISKQDYTNAVASAAQAAAAVAQNRAALQTSTINLRFTRVPAPISGRIGRSLFTTGALVTSGQAEALTTIQRLDPIFVDIQQSSADLLALRRSLAKDGIAPSSAAVRLQLEDGSDYGSAGRVQFSEPVVDATTGTVTLRASFSNPSGLLLPGMYVRARLSQATVQNAILAPQAGISRDPRGRATALVIGPGNKAELRTVTADRSVGNRWLITAGLKPGDRLIVEGLGNIKPGQVVKPVPAGSKPQPRPPVAADAAAKS